jgi:serine/threonine protein kinase
VPKITGYRILEKIGEGGMGDVYAAEQLRPIQRRVAVKIIKPGMDSREVVARFESERQALAMMNHVSIAKVFDAGTTTRGLPYFVMELVPGDSITQHCDRHRLSTRERLALFIQVCLGVQHAHQKAIIHRDLKPSNVLITLQDDVPVPKIIDFGVAKATAKQLTDKTMFTEQGQIMGTLEYMSPEQAAMSSQDIDTRTDIYSLGAILYELLVGARPFDSQELRSGGFDGFRRTIREQDPPKPSTRFGLLGGASALSAENRRTDSRMLTRQVRGDLDWITMKALDKDRTRRYETANGLAMDIARHLADEPVLASPPSATYRIGKFVRRHRAGFTTAAATAVALVAGLALATYGFVTASHERDQKELALTEAEAVTEFLADMLAAVDPGKEGREVTVREVLDEASLTLGTAFGDQPLVEARLRQTVGEPYQALGLDEAAAAAYLRANCAYSSALSCR